MASLYQFQQDAIRELLGGKRIIIAGTGCLAGDTPIPLADGGWKRADELSSGDIILSYNEDKREFVRGEVDCVFRTCHKPKPMIQLEYDGEQITTTYDHPFFNGEGYYPLYQLIWGALETSQRVQLKLLCEQYGQTFNDKAVWCKHCSSNEASVGRKWVLQNNDGWADSKSPQNCSRELAGEPYQLGMCEPFELRQGRQPSREPRVVLNEIQCLVWDKARQYQQTTEREQQEGNERAKRICKSRISKIRKGDGEKAIREHGKSKILRQDVQGIPKRFKGNDTGMGLRKVKVKVSEPYYSICMREAPYTYCIGRKHYFITHNTGKSAMAMKFVEQMTERTGKRKFIVVTTASKSRARNANGDDDFTADARLFCSSSFSNSLSSSLSLISWHKLNAWVNQHWGEIEDYIFIFDELAKAKAGISSGMGKAFLKITKRTTDWAGFTATPGENWLHYYPYFVACGLARNKTSFMNEYANVQTFKGYPEIVGWRHEDELRDMWARISYAPDASQVLRELPSETHRVIVMSKPKDYAKTLKTRQRADGEMLDTTMALCHYLRQLCFTKQKQEWVKDFVENLGERAVIFYSYIEEGDKLEEICKKATGGKVWRIDGRHHDIPTEGTCGERDVVLCQWQSGSEGLNFQFISQWVSVSPTYSYATSIQARGRVKRIGAKRPIFYWYLKCEDCIEGDVYKALKAKQSFSEDNWAIDNNLIKED